MAGAAITITVEDAQVREALGRLSAAATDLTPALRQIGETLTETTQKRFVTSTSPDGTPWAPNSPVTLQRYLAARSGSFSKKTGKLTAKGIASVLGKKPLVGLTGNLASTIHYQVGAKQVAIGSNLIYSAVQQFGALRGAFGSNARGRPIPWGDIPARPYLGVSVEDTGLISELIGDHLRRALG